MGGLRKYIPFTAAMMAIGTLALTGFPFTAGYYSKDAIIEAAYAAHRAAGTFAFLATVVAAFMTSFYSWRLFFMTFEGQPRWAMRIARARRHEGVEHDDAATTSSRPRTPTTITGTATATTSRTRARSSCWSRSPCWRSARSSPAFVFHDAFIGEGYDEFWKGALFTRPDNHILEEMHHVPALVPLLPTIMMSLGFLLAVYMYIVDPRSRRSSRPTTRSCTGSCSTSGTSTSSTTPSSCVRRCALGRFLWQTGDGRIIDGLGPTASRPASSTSPAASCGSRPATSTTTPSRC